MQGLTVNIEDIVSLVQAGEGRNLRIGMVDLTADLSQ